MSLDFEENRNSKQVSSDVMPELLAGSAAGAPPYSAVFTVEVAAPEHVVAIEAAAAGVIDDV